jgi:hypothetical protein
MIKNKIFRHHFYQYFKIIRKKLLRTIKVIKLQGSYRSKNNGDPHSIKIRDPNSIKIIEIPIVLK